jgi:DNA-directed RNA polymerase subunit beta'
LVEPDTAIGTLAALTIGGELGRLEYFTYYGLSARRDPYPEGKIYAAHAGKVSLKNLDLAINRAGERIVVSSSGEIELLDDWERVVEQHVVPHGAVLPVAAGSCVQRGDLLAEWNVHFQPILAKAPGRVRFEDLVPKRSIESEPSASGKLCWKVLSWPRGRYPRIRVTDIAKETVDTCYLPRGAQLDVVDGQQVEMGELLARAPTVSASAYESIEGGLARLSDLFHLRPPESTAVLAEADGIVEQTTMVEPGICNVLVHLVDHRGELCGDSIVQRVDMQRYTRLLVRNKQRVKAGEPLTSGDPDPHEVLRILGPETAARRLLDEMQMCFLLQGESIEIDDRHFEVILAQMLRYVEVESPGDSQFSAGEVVERSRLFALNRKMHDFLVVVDRGDSLLEREKIASLKLFEKMVARAEKRGDDPPQGRLPWPAGWRALLLGIDQAARRSSSFLTAAGYGTTQRALVEAAVANRSFGLETVKDRVLLGRKLQKTDRK